MHAGDPRADPAVVDLIELAGLWLAAQDRPAMDRTLERLCSELERRFPSDQEFAARFRELQSLARARTSTEELRRRYRRASLG